MRNILVILALFVYTYIYLGQLIEIIVNGDICDEYGYHSGIAGNGDPNSDFGNYGKVPYGGLKDPKDKRLIINSVAVVGIMTVVLIWINLVLKMKISY